MCAPSAERSATSAAWPASPALAAKARLRIARAAAGIRAEVACVTNALRPRSVESTCVSAPSRKPVHAGGSPPASRASAASLATVSNVESTPGRWGLSTSRATPACPACCGLVRFASSIAHRSATSALAALTCAAAISTTPAFTAAAAMAGSPLIVAVAASLRKGAARRRGGRDEAKPEGTLQQQVYPISGARHRRYPLALHGRLRLVPHSPRPSPGASVARLLERASPVPLSERRSALLLHLGFIRRPIEQSRRLRAAPVSPPPWALSMTLYLPLTHQYHWP
eukprot:scaffold92245_cov24-Tisochrysis_lutea.AAC.3